MVMLNLLPSDEMEDFQTRGAYGGCAASSACCAGWLDMLQPVSCVLYDPCVVVLTLALCKVAHLCMVTYWVVYLLGSKGAQRGVVTIVFGWPFGSWCRYMSP